MLELPPLSLYIHVPWCIRKCPYCDFNSHEAQEALPESEYIAALCDDFDRELDRAENRELQSIFIGGGTPSLFSAAAFEKLLNHIQKRSKLSEQIEITLEANPGTAEASKFEDYRSVGINRLSLGIQSFDDTHLQSLGRVHDGLQARKAIDIAKRSGFENLNLDLMHGLPTQVEADALKDLHIALDFSPAHLSWYQLTIEPNTVFYSQPPTLPPDTILDRIQEAGQQLLCDNGYNRYEVSAYSLPGKHSVHNLNYWQFGDYLGIGAGAHGKLTYPEKNILVRVRKIKQPQHYLRNELRRDAEVSEINENDRPLEFLLNALRIKQGFSMKTFENRTGVPFSTIGKKVEYLVSKDLLSQNDEWITTTEKGYRLLNSLLEEFL